MPEIDHLPTKERVSLAVAEEGSVLSCLNKNLVSRNLVAVAASSFDDMVNKTDFLLFPIGDKERKLRWPCAIKMRTEKEDILVAVYDPWYGPNHELNKIGRDMKCEYIFYVTVDPNKTKLRVACGKIVHRIINDMIQELQDSKFRLPLYSEKHPTCQLRKHIDRWSGKPKILGFIPPKYLKENTEIVYYNYKE